MRRPITITFCVLLCGICSTIAAEPALSPAGAKLLKHATSMGKKRAPSKYDEKRLQKMLEAAARDDLKLVAERLRALPKATPAHEALADRISGRYWDARYPGSSALPGFAAGLALKTTPERAMLLRAALTLEDLTTARMLAVETLAWKDPAVRVAAGETLLALLDLSGGNEKSDAALLGLLKDPDPVVRCLVARGLDEAGRKEALDAYTVGLEDTAARTIESELGEETYCFGSQAFYRLAELSKRHDSMEYAEYRKLPDAKRAEVALDLVAWWKEARARFSFNDSKWEKFAATPIVHEKVIDVARPKDAFFRFRSPHDRSMVTLELTHVEFTAGKGDAWNWIVDWRLSVGVAGRRGGFDMIEARHVPVNRRWGKPKEGLGRVSVAVQRIGEKKARVVVWFADFQGKK